MKLNNNSTMKQLNDTVQTLQNLIAEGHLSWAQAIYEFRSEFGYSLNHCMHMGIVKYFQQADKNYNKL